MKIFIIGCVLIMGWGSQACAEMFYLNSGEVVEGNVRKEDNDYYTVTRTDGADEIIFKSEIKKRVSSDEVDVEEITIPVTLNRAHDFDFKSRDDIFAIRRRYVENYPELFKRLYRGVYQPSDQVFGQLEGGKAWWGTLGMSYYGPGKDSHKGPSEEARFIGNPYLLIGLSEMNAHVVNHASLKPIDIYPKPHGLSFSKKKQSSSVTYNLRDYWRKQAKYLYPDADDHRVKLVAYNARDFGFTYLSIDADQSQNVRVTEEIKKPLLINQFIHRGDSCGHSGGCNNMSPDDLNFEVGVSELPARLVVKLWRKKPVAGKHADLECSLELQ